MKKKIISVVLVMTMVFALLAVSASAIEKSPITSVTITGVPASLTVGQSVADIKSAIGSDSDDYSVASVMILDAAQAEVTNTITTAGTYTLRVELSIENRTCIFTSSTIVPEGAEGLVLMDGFKLRVTYTLTATEPQVGPTPDPTPDPDVDPDIDFDFSGLFGKIFDLIRWKKVSDDVKTFSILSIIFELLEAIAARLATFFKK